VTFKNSVTVCKKHLFLHNNKPVMVEDVLANLPCWTEAALATAVGLNHTLERSCIIHSHGHQRPPCRLQTAPGIHSSSPAEAQLQLEFLGIAGFFKAVITMDTFGIRKPFPPPRHCRRRHSLWLATGLTAT